MPKKESSAQIIFIKPDQRKGCRCVGVQVNDGTVRELIEIPEFPGFRAIGRRISQEKGDQMISDRQIGVINLVED